MTNAELNRTVHDQKKTINHLSQRVGQLIDELAVLRSELQTFKTKVANDMGKVVKTLQSK